MKWSVYYEIVLSLTSGVALITVFCLVLQAYIEEQQKK